MADEIPFDVAEKQFGVKAPREVSFADAEKLGVKAPSSPAAPKEDPLAQYPGTAFALGSLNKLGMGGGSAALALKDTLKVTDSATGQNDKSGRSAKELYLANKAFYDDGFKRLGNANPKADFASNAAYLIGPTKGGSVLGRGVASGAAQGFVGGPSSLVDDPEGVMKDTAAGGAFGAAGAALSAIPGKLLERVGSAAKGRLSGLYREALKSAQGVAGKQGQEAAGGVENKWIARQMEKDLNAGNDTFVGQIPTAWIRKGIGARVANADEKIIDKNVNPVNVRALAEKKIQGVGNEAVAAAKRYAMAGVGGYVGGEVADKLGVDKRIGYALGAGAPIWALRNSWSKVLDHPESLKKLAGLKPVGEFIKRHGAKFGSAEAAAVGLATLAKQHPEVEQALNAEVESLGSPVDPTGEVPDQR